MIIWGYILDILPYLSVTCQYVGSALVFGSVLAVLLAAAKLGKNRILKAIANGYTTVLRCVPSLVLLFLSYYALPVILKSVFGFDIYDVNKIIFVIFTLSLSVGATLSEIIRSAYLSVNKGQFDAAVSTGLTPVQAITRIIFPQALYFSIPNLGNLLIGLLKEGALAFTIGLIDVMGRAYNLSNLTYGAKIVEIYTAMALIYWGISIIIEWLFKRMERVCRYI